MVKHFNPESLSKDKSNPGSEKVLSLPSNESQFTDSELAIPLDSDEFIPPISRWVKVGGWFLLVSAAVTVGLASVTPSPANVRAPASVRPEGEVKIVQATAEGRIERLQVQENQKVEQGQIIAIIDDSRLQTRKSQLESSIQQGQLQLQQLSNQIVHLNSQITSEQNLRTFNITSAQSELARTQREHADKSAIALREVQEIEASLAAAEAEYKALEKAAREGAIAEVQVKSKYQTYLAAQARLKRAQAALNPTSATVSVAQQQINQAKVRGESTLAALRKDRETLRQQQVQVRTQIDKDQKELQQVINDLQDTKVRTQVGGTILKIGLRNEGQVVRPGEVIAQVSPQHAPLIIKARVPPQDIGKIRVGQEVNMRVSAYTYTDYGTLKGKVISIASDAITPPPQAQQSTSPNNPEATNPYFEVTIQPDQTYLVKGESKYEVQAGMEVQADIISNKETILIFVLRKARLLVGI